MAKSDPPFLPMSTITGAGSVGTRGRGVVGSGERAGVGGRRALGGAGVGGHDG